MSQDQERLRAMSDEELSSEWVRAMTASIAADNRDERMAAIESVAREVNERYERTGFTSLVVTPEDAQAVSEHLKGLTATGNEGWFSDTAEQS